MPAKDDDRADTEADARHGDVFSSTLQELLDRTAAVADFFAKAGTGVAAPAVPAVNGLLASVQHLAEQVPAPTAQLDMFLHELQAKRALVRALQEQLAAFESQLDLLERSLAPLTSWSRQWSRYQDLLIDSARAAHPDPPR